MKQIRVIITDDQADCLLLLNSILRDAGFEVTRAYGGEDLVKKVRRLRPDIVLTDLEMPNFGGVEVIQALKSDPTTRDIPIIAVTAHTRGDLMTRAASAGCAGFIEKPFKAARLIAEIERLLTSTNTIALEPSEPGLRLATDQPFVVERTRD